MVDKELRRPLAVLSEEAYGDEEGDELALEIVGDDDNDEAMFSSSATAMSTTPSIEQVTTFRDDVRREWIHAVLGPLWTEKTQQHNNDHIHAGGIHKGMGSAQIAPYTAYSVTIPAATAESTAKSSASPTSASSSIPKPRLGISLSRLALGLYVRNVQPGSEAWCAGILPQSILVSINGMVLLAETSQAALERLWQYEGHVINSVKNSAATTTSTNTTTNNTTRIPSQSKTCNPTLDVTSTSTPTSQHCSTKIREPLHLQFIHQGGKLYDVLFLSNPPYGIDWAPCGNFALVRKSEHASIAVGSLLARISTTNTDQNNSCCWTMQDLDHTLAAETLRNCCYVPSSQSIHLTFCIPPSESRSGYWERRIHQNNLIVNGHKRRKSLSTSTTMMTPSHNEKPSSTATATTNITTTTQRAIAKTRQRRQVAAELEGVQVRVHPLLQAPDSSRYLDAAAAAVNSTIDTKQAPMMIRTWSSLAFRVAAGEFFSWNTTIINNSRDQQQRRGGRQPKSSPHCSFRPCPPLDQPLLQLWNMDQALSFLLHYHQANYQEELLETNTIRCHDHHSSNNSSSSLEFLKRQSPQDAWKILDSFAFWIFIWMQSEPQQSPSRKAMKQWLMSRIFKRPDNDHRHNIYAMECMARSLELQDLESTLTKIRQEQIISVSSLPSKSRKSFKHHNNHTLGVERTSMAASQSLTVNPKPSAFTTDSNPSGTGANTPTTIATNGSEAVSSESTKNPTKKKRGIFGFFRKMKNGKKKPPENGNPELSISTHQDDTNIMKSSRSSPISKAYSSGRLIPHIPSNGSLSLTRPISIRSQSKNSHNPMTNITDSNLLFANSLKFLQELEGVCLEIEKSLMRSFSQKIAAWALPPWSASKETELAQVTQVMRERLRTCSSCFPLWNPVTSSSLSSRRRSNSLLTSVDARGSYILPSAHFPLLLTFECQESSPGISASTGSHRMETTRFMDDEEVLYRTQVELLKLRVGNLTAAPNDEVASVPKRPPPSFVAHGSVGGTVVTSGPSIATKRMGDNHVWDTENVLTFDCRSSWGGPGTFSLQLSQSAEQIVGSDENGNLKYERNVGQIYLDISRLWKDLDNKGARQMKSTESFQMKLWSSSGLNGEFDQHGDLPGGEPKGAVENIDIQVNVTVERNPLTDDGGLRTKKCSLLYKHDDDVRQELFAIDFIKLCDNILKSSGLDLKLLTFRCIPVGKSRGFLEWVQGSVPLSEICQPFGCILAGRNNKKEAPPTAKPDTTVSTSPSEEDPLSSIAKAGLTKYESLRREQSRLPSFNPIQDFLRAFHFRSEDPYMIQKDAMETYVKSCAGYSVITYILGVGDRHLDNLLLHPTGHFFHCDYSFILGDDPKKYLPLRITEDMVNGMGGRESDNFALFLSLMCASFLTLRRPENVRCLMSLVRMLENCCSLPKNADSNNKEPFENAVMGIRNRLCLDLSDDEAISFMENLVEESCASRMWMAVDAIHSLGKRF